MIDLRQTPEYANHLKNIGWKVSSIGRSASGRERKTYVYIKKLPLIGSVIKVQRPEIIDYQYIDVLAVKHRAFQIIIEPKDKDQELKIKNLKFKISKNPYLPTKTLQLDLTKSVEGLIKGMKKDCRQAIRKNYQLSINNYQLKDLEKFRNSWKKAVGWKRYVPPLSHLISLKKTFGSNSLFLLHRTSVMKYGGLSGAIFLKTKDIAYYWQAFTNNEGRRLQAQYKIVWEGILWAKRKGAKVFDFEGVYDKRFPNKSWMGFTHFKKSFGGYVVEYPGAYTKHSLRNLI